jgi:hypothetical protein
LGEVIGFFTRWFGDKNIKRKTFIFDWFLQQNFNHKQHLQLKSP